MAGRAGYSARASSLPHAASWRCSSCSPHDCSSFNTRLSSAIPCSPSFRRLLAARCRRRFWITEEIPTPAPPPRPASAAWSRLTPKTKWTNEARPQHTEPFRARPTVPGKCWRNPSARPSTAAHRSSPSRPSTERLCATGISSLRSPPRLAAEGSQSVLLLGVIVNCSQHPWIRFAPPFDLPVW